jgi:hypothetical protein
MGSHLDVRGDVWIEVGFAASLCARDLGSGSVGRAEIELVVVEVSFHHHDCVGDDSPCTT